MCQTEDLDRIAQHTEKSNGTVGEATIAQGSRQNDVSVDRPEVRSGLGRLLFCATGICVCYLSYGVLHEHLFKTNDKSKPPALGASFVLLTQCVTNVAVAMLWDQLQLKKSNQPTSPDATSSTKPLSLPQGLLFITAAFYVTAMVCSNEAIRYVSYPVQVLVKSCKLIPTMIVGQFAERRLYSQLEWLAALSISLGICLFQYSRSASTASTDAWNGTQTYGMLLLLASLTMDGLLSSMQTIVKRAPQCPNAIETMLYINAYAVVFLLPLCWVTGQWHSAMHSLSAETTWSTAASLVLLNATVAAGQVFIFLTIAWFSPVTTTLITTTRKFGTILLSVYMYGHAFTATQWLAVAMVFAGLYGAILTTVTRGQKIKTA